jgi:hypothetical protein
MCMFCRSLFALLSFFFLSLCCLFFFCIRILITPLVSSNCSYLPGAPELFCVDPSSGFFVVFYLSLFVCFSLFGSFYCMSFFDLRLLITTLDSSNFYWLFQLLICNVVGTSYSYRGPGCLNELGSWIT